MEKVCISFSCYNNSNSILNILNSIEKQDYKNLSIVIADDGSSDDTTNIIDEFIKTATKDYILLKEPHLERGITRKKSIDKALNLNCEYILIIDSDMILEDNLISKCISYFEKNKKVGALVIPEIPFSEFDNFYSKVKVFERKIINNLGEDLGKNSIEAARFWKVSEYKKSGGINPKQIAFEETQPTIRYLKQNGIIKRACFTGVHHDEKKVTLKNILEKKAYYFRKMKTTLQTEEKGSSKAFSRWYFFRPVLYTKSNLKEYIKHPILTIGLINMYILLTIVAVYSLLTRKK
ncbi:MAG: glycosyltransferase family 2 protein [Peptostreptococcaceae bacterium]|jgi:glycosyltransferase involved in cell wall biosynthesis|nr:glycosyltransferase family 2 protein [Peptostreptococcaceae bacterium]